ncbi:hypothetical protein [Thalassospira sp. HJ]|uniref:hypothetical protein n=1 Tax=Thalassospira sp. HJ TaxID=1616823 RepID=UPI000B2A7468|nr:hypothetical protein [Thalassospira sp. HJ]
MSPLLRKENLKYPHSGLFSTFRRKFGKPIQNSYFMRQLDFIYENTANINDFFISQCVFSEKNRRKINLKYFTHAWVDIDYYRIESLSRFSKEQIAQQLIDFIQDNGIPYPSSIIDSGNGIYLKWHFSSYVRKEAGRKLEAVNRQLISLFADFGADTGTHDASRILRFVGSINTKAGSPVSFIQETGLFYDFEMFCDEILPPIPEAKPSKVLSYRAEKAKRAVLATRAFTRQDYAWKVLCDLEKLIKARFVGGEVLEGHRDRYGFIGACQISIAFSSYPDADIRQEILTWAKQHLSSSYVNDELRNYISSLLQRVSRHRRGERVEFMGKKITPIYTYKKDTLINLFEVQTSEMEQLNLTVLIDRRVKYDRKNKKRRKGALSADDKLSILKCAIEEAKSANEIINQSYLAETTGFSQPTVYRLLKKL